MPRRGFEVQFTSSPRFFPLVSTHVLWSGVAWHNETGHLFKIMAIIMLKQFDCRQKDPKTGQQRWRRGLLSPDLSAAQPHQQVAQGDHLWGCCPLKTPNHDTGHRRHQQSIPAAKVFDNG